MRQIDEEQLNEGVEVTPTDTQVVETQEPKNDAASYLGTNLQHKIGGYGETDKEADNKLETEKKLSRIGEQIGGNAEIRDGWMEVDRSLLGERSMFYPEAWKFRIRPATVEAIRNWSTIDDENPNVVDDVFNEIMKSCFAIVGEGGRAIPWHNVRSWDRFFFVLLIREYTFVNGETKIEYTEDCPNCDNPVTITLNSQELGFELPDPDVIKYFSKEEQNWMIDPNEYDVEWPEPITLYLPTLEKDANIKAWMIDRIQNKKKVDQVFIKFLPWMAQKISKDLSVATRQIREYEVKFKSWDTDMFSFMNDVINNISVTPDRTITTVCPICGEEVVSEIRFPNGVSALFNVSSGRKKFGKK